MASDSSTSLAGDSPPKEGSESCGSSVSTTLREEYEDLLRYAVVIPRVDASISGLQTKGTPATSRHSTRAGSEPLPPRRSTPPVDVSRSAILKDS